MLAGIIFRVDGLYSVDPFAAMGTNERAITMLMEIVNKNYKKLNATDINVLTYIVQHGSSVTDMGIEALAKECFTSKSTVLRLVQKLGFSGFSDFKSYIKWENENGAVKQDYRNRLDVVGRDLSQTIRTLRGSADVVAIAQAIAQANTVVLFGTGEAQRYCAREMQRCFMELGVYLYYVGAREELNMLMKMLRMNDLVVFISLSGDAKGLDEALHTASVCGIRTASITNFAVNELAERCDYNVYATCTPVAVKRTVEHSSFASFFVAVESIFTHYLQLCGDEALEE